MPDLPPPGAVALDHQQPAAGRDIDRSLPAVLGPARRPEADRPARRTGARIPSASRSDQPKRECSHAMSSVCTTAEPGTASPIRAASVVLPALLRPSTARMTGRPDTTRLGPRPISASITAVSDSARHGPASGSSRASCKVTPHHLERTLPSAPHASTLSPAGTPLPAATFHRTNLLIKYRVQPENQAGRRGAATPSTALDPTSNNWRRPCTPSSPSPPGKPTPILDAAARHRADRLAKATTDQIQAALAYLSMIDPEAFEIAFTAVSPHHR